MEELRKKLKEVFGYDTFRGNQEPVIQNILAGKNTFVIMPTGAGKSMCYQMPAIVRPGTAIVISPLIALMKNQVDQMNAVGINARFLNSTLTSRQIFLLPLLMKRTVFQSGVTILGPNTAELKVLSTNLAIYPLLRLRLQLPQKYS